MPRHYEKRHLPFGPVQLYELVADVRKYPDFLPWVVAMRVRRDSPAETVADMIVGFKALRESFTSRVIKTPHSQIAIDYLDGPLKHLHNVWAFSSDGQGGCYIDFEVDFAFKNSLFERMAGQFFETALTRMIGAFEQRAHVLYGAGGSNSSSAYSTA